MQSDLVILNLLHNISKNIPCWGNYHYKHVEIYAFPKENVRVKQVAASKFSVRTESSVFQNQSLFRSHSQIWEELALSAHPVPLRGHHDYKQHPAVVLMQDSPLWLNGWQNNGLQWMAQTSVFSRWIILTAETEGTECSLSINFHKKCQRELKLSVSKPFWKWISVNIFIQVSDRILSCSSQIGMRCCNLC